MFILVWAKTLLCSGFSIAAYKKIWMNLLTNPIHRNFYLCPWSSKMQPDLLNPLTSLNTTKHDEPRHWVPPDAHHFMHRASPTRYSCQKYWAKIKVLELTSIFRKQRGQNYKLNNTIRKLIDKSRWQDILQNNWFHFHCMTKIKRKGSVLWIKMVLKNTNIYYLIISVDEKFKSGIAG